jgi:ABC-type protease/lipase transport system fused ATPase/permease subunit
MSSRTNKAILRTPRIDHMLPVEISKCTANAPATQASNCGKVFANANKKNSFLSRRSDKMFWTGFMFFLVSFLFDGLIGALPICGAICLVVLAIRRRLKEMKHNVRHEARLDSEAGKTSPRWRG